MADSRRGSGKGGTEKHDSQERATAPRRPGGGSRRGEAVPARPRSSQRPKIAASHGAAGRDKPRPSPPRRSGSTGGKRPPARRPTPPSEVGLASDDAREIAVAAAIAALDKKAIGVEILDVTGKVDYTELLLIMTGRSDRHVQAIAAGVEEALRRRKVRALSIEGLPTASWVLLDFGDVVVHVFQEQTRALYDIEGLWIDAARVPLPPPAKAEEAAR